MVEGKSDAELIAMAKELPSRKVRFDENGEPWTNQPDPALRQRIRELYKKLCASGEEGSLLVATHQEFIVRLDALIEDYVAQGNAAKAGPAESV